MKLLVLEIIRLRSFWEYDTRTAVRWNLDPKPVVGVSEYSTFNGNPIHYSDVNGDCATCPKGAKFGTTHTEEDAEGSTPVGGGALQGREVS